MSNKKSGAPSNLENIDDVNKFINKVVKELTSGCAAIKSPTGPIIYSFNVRIDPANAASSPFTVAAPLPKKEPLVDIIDRSKQVSVLAELQGISKDRMEVYASSSRLRISAQRTGGAYSNTVNLPCSVDPKTAVARYNNGVLEVTFDKSAQIAEEIKVAFN